MLKSEELKNERFTLQKLKSQRCCNEISAYIFSHYYLHDTADTIKLLYDLIDLSIVQKFHAIMI